MKQEENQKKFHEALLKMLYLPPSPPPLRDEDGKPKNSIDSLYHLPDAGKLEDKKNHSSSSSGDDKDGGSGKLTRAQRKRLRKRKFKEAASRRREIIGPLLPDDGTHGGGDIVTDTLQAVRQNGASGSNTVTSESGEPPAYCAKQNKIKQRRKAKKLYC